MIIFTGEIGFSGVSAAGAVVTPQYTQRPLGTKENVVTYKISPVKESGLTKFFLQAFDISKNTLRGYGTRAMSFWSQVVGDLGKSGSSVQIRLQEQPYSGATWIYFGTKLRASGTSISGASGAVFSRIANPVIAPRYRLSFEIVAAGSTQNMKVFYAFISD